jgi:alkylation response protein AidB-like acyl-CoA dehydrogenase
MDLLPTAQQDDIAAVTSDLLEALLPFKAIQDLSASGREDPELWLRAGEGWIGLGLPASVGGAGGGLGEELMFARELGRYLVPGPFLGNIIGAHVALDGGNAEMAEALLAGTPRLALAWPADFSHHSTEQDPRKGPWACSLATEIDGLVVLSEQGAVILTGTMDDGPSDRIDPLHPIAGVSGDLDVQASVEGYLPLVRAQLLLAAQLVGIAERTRDLSTAHAKTRVQFGQPIGAFQAVKHRCADMAVRCESAWAMTSYASAATEQGQPGLSFYAASAKLLAARAAIDNSRENVQNHGAMGFTLELGAHLYLRTAHALDNTLGDMRTLLDGLRSAEWPQPAFG